MCFFTWSNINSGQSFQLCVLPLCNTMISSFLTRQHGPTTLSEFSVASALASKFFRLFQDRVCLIAVLLCFMCLCFFPGWDSAKIQWAGNRSSVQRFRRRHLLRFLSLTQMSGRTIRDEHWMKIRERLDHSHTNPIVSEDWNAIFRWFRQRPSRQHRWSLASVHRCTSK